MPPSLEIAIATMGLRDPQPLLERMGLRSTDASPRPEADVDVLIINQCPDGPVPQPLSAPRLRMLSYTRRGLSVSRNAALQHARGEVLLFADDDITYVPGFEDRVLEALGPHPDCAGMSFQFVDRDTGRPAKSYASLAAVHTRRSIGAVSSVELAVRPGRLHGLRFDERFGLGARYPVGEEAIFLNDGLDRGLEFLYSPHVICAHPGLASGHRQWSHAGIEARGAMLRRLYPRVWPAAALAYGVLKYPGFHGEIGPASFGRALWAGALARRRP